MAETPADIRAAIEGGWLGNTLKQPLSQTEVEELIESSKADIGAPFVPEICARLAETKRTNPADYERIIERLKADAKVRVGPLEKLIKGLDQAEREVPGDVLP